MFAPILAGFMSDLESTCPFDLLDAAMRDPSLQQAFRQLDQRHLCGIIARVCRSSYHLSSTTNSSLKVKISTELNEETGKPDVAISFIKWLQRNIGNLSSLDLTSEVGIPTFAKYSALSKMLQTITSTTQLCSLRLDVENGTMFGAIEMLSALTNLSSLALCSCHLSSGSFSSMLALTQLRALELRDVDVRPDMEGEQQIMRDLTSSLVNLTSLTLINPPGWLDVKEALACIRSLPKLVDLDIRGTFILSGSLVSLVGGLPITGLMLCLEDPGHIFDVAGWLERCVPSTLRCLQLSTWRNCWPSSSQVSRLISPLSAAGPQLQSLTLLGCDLSQADSVNIITGLTQLTSLKLRCEFQDDDWGLLEPAFARLEVLEKNRVSYSGMSWFHAEAALLSQV